MRGNIDSNKVRRLKDQVSRGEKGGEWQQEQEENDDQQRYQ